MAKQYYASRTPGKFGVYFGEYINCQKMLQGPGQLFKGFQSEAAARSFVHKYSESLSTSDSLILSAQPQDLPQEICHGILSLFGVDQMKELSQEQLLSLTRAFEGAYDGEKPVDYRGKTEEYAMIYLPVNMYKIWIPLRKLLAAHCLPTDCSELKKMVPIRVLELGAGPGTSTFGFLDFYKLLAFENPGTEFAINYNIVELEQDFEHVFETLKNAYLKTLPSNLRVTIQRTIQRDAENHMLYCGGMNYDLIIESNMVNSSEHHQTDYQERMITDIISALRPGGFSILIEPGTNSNIAYLNDLLSNNADNIWQAPEKGTCSMEKNSLYKEQCNFRIRRPGRYQHWMSSCILTKPFKEMAL